MSVSLGLALDEQSLLDQFGATAEAVRPAVLLGSDDQVVDGVAAYVEAGADEVIIGSRGMTGLEPLARFAGLVEPFR